MTSVYPGDTIGVGSIEMQTALAEFDTTLELRDEIVVGPVRAPIAPNLDNPAAQLPLALEQPHQFPPLHRALTPDDHLAVVVDERLALAGELAGALLTYLTDFGIVSECITLLSPPGARQAWVEALPDVVQDVRTEIHDPANRKHLSYLASTKRGRRVYLNRTLVDADQVIVLAGCRYDPLFGVADAASQLFPAFSDTETIAGTARRLSLAPPGDSERQLQQEATEVAWLLGVPFFVQVVDGVGDGVAHMIGGTADAAPECRRLLAERWRMVFPRPAQTVVVTVAGASPRQDFEALARAALCASRVVEPGGRIVILSHANPSLGEAVSLIRDADNPAVAYRLVQERQHADSAAALMWLEAARNASLYLLSGLDEVTVEELFAIPLQQARQAQRLLDSASSALVIEEGDKALALIAP